MLRDLSHGCSCRGQSLPQSVWALKGKSNGDQCTDTMTRTERRTPHNEQADPQLKSAVLWGWTRPPPRWPNVWSNTLDMVQVHVDTAPTPLSRKSQAERSSSLNFLHMHCTDGQHMCDRHVRLAGHMQITVWQSWMLGCIRKHEGVEKERETTTLLLVSVNQRCAIIISICWGTQP